MIFNFPLTAAYFIVWTPIVTAKISLTLVVLVFHLCKIASVHHKDVTSQIQLHFHVLFAQRDTTTKCFSIGLNAKFLSRGLRHHKPYPNFNLHITRMIHGINNCISITDFMLDAKFF